MRQGRRFAVDARGQQARRPEAHEMQPGGRGVGLQGVVRVDGQIAGEHRRLGLAVEHLAADALARHRHADDARQPFVADLGVGLARRPQSGERLHADLRAGVRSAAHGAIGDDAQDRLQPVVAGGMDVVRLGGGEQQLVDAAHEQRAQPVAGAGAEHAQDGLERALQVDDGVAALVERPEHVDEHDLPVEAAEVVAEERPHDVRLIALEAPRHHGGERRARIARLGAERQRTEGEQRRAFEIARQQEAPGPRRVQHVVVGARGLEVGGEQVGAAQGDLLVLRPVGIDARQKLAPGFRMRLPPRCRRLRHRLGAPLLVAHVEQRQVDQPLAGIIDDVEVEPRDAESAAQGAGRLELDGDAHLAKAAGALRPLGRIARQGVEVRLVVEARHRVVGLRLEVGALDAPLGLGHEERQPPAGDEVADQRGDEDGLAGARQPGDAEPQRGRHHVGQQGAGAMPSLARGVVQIGNGRKWTRGDLSRVPLASAS